MTESTPPSMRPSVKVYDPLVRVAHLCFIVGVIAAWFTRHAGGAWHEWIGYAVMAALILRLFWGFSGSASARFTRFIRGPVTTARYAMNVLHGSAARHLGHNPLGAWMIVALLVTLAVIVGTGYMFTTDRWFGYGWVIRTHEISTWILFALVPIHVAGVLHASWKHHEDLIAAMLHGRKPGASGTDVKP